ncbi:CCR4-NOT transcription complex subunit 11-like isoform X2 [Pollicipes pollicipes]|uniref:CCR4-NOT transcription complex subunit 11-like isoform X2 n=1 Tax=Pollicipes pollicipes TaxID=41117 RepID=UPI00188495DD|nr:CCR4-NOT transcription complex subunit 11-like isoform X2 [Pollicipes pollicipes]XP_037070791.1 CCR4-NOT transcription complex subunit 11-like isoform X2 [Pollicipes pollicipes]
MALSTKDISSLLGLLSEDTTEQQSVEVLASQCCSTFSKQDHFKVGNALVFLLLQPDMLPLPQQRIVATAILYFLYKNEPLKRNPFANVFLHIMHTELSKAPGKPADPATQFTKFTPGEKYFVRQLITNPNKELFKKTASQLLQSDLTATHAAADASLAELEAVVRERLADVPAAARAGVTVVVPDPDLRPDASGAYSEQNVTRRTAEGVLGGPTPYAQQCVSPEFLRLPPPLHNCQDEMVYMVPSEPHEHQVAYDPSLLTAPAGVGEARQLMALAVHGPLTLQQQNQLISQLKRDLKTVYQVGVTPAKLPDLVEHNPIIAIEVLLQLMDSPQITDYFNVLVNMEMSLHSMEVVNRLTTAVELPAEFVHLYITNCIATCEAIKDRYMQNRLVRLVCVFLQSLIRNKIINVHTILIEVQAFCIDFNRIREAAALFRLLKQLDSNEHVSQLPPGQRT